MNWALVVLLGYIAAQLAIGFVVSRRVTTEEDYILAGRKLGPWLATFSIFATWFGAETCIGASGAVYAGGLSEAHADPFGYTICLLLMAVLFAAALWRRQLMTLGDLFRERYGPRAESIAVLMMIPTSLLWAGAQIRAFGQVLAVNSGWQLNSAITLAAAVVVIYTVAGGLWADAATDLLQGIVLIVGLVVVFIAVIVQAGGINALWGTVPAERWNPLGSGHGFHVQTLESWLVPILGSVTAQELASRVMASRSVRVARNATYAAAALYLAIGMIPVLLGLAGPTLLPGLTDSETFLPQLAHAKLGPILAAVFSGALISAILSTVDSSLLAVGALGSHNLVMRAYPRASERQRVRAARIGVVLAGFGAYALAFSADGVYGLVEQASAFGGAGIFVLMVFGLFSRFGGRWAGGTALIVSIVVQLWGTYVSDHPYPFTLSLAVSAAAYVLVGWIERFRG